MLSFASDSMNQTKENSIRQNHNSSELYWSSTNN
jgi:hypothetical protein